MTSSPVPVDSADDPSSSSAMRRKASLVPALPITTQTTRLISQQSRTGRDSVEVGGGRGLDLPAPPTVVSAEPLSNQPELTRTASRAAASSKLTPLSSNGDTSSPPVDNGRLPNPGTPAHRPVQGTPTNTELPRTASRSGPAQKLPSGTISMPFNGDVSSPPPPSDTGMLPNPVPPGTPAHRPAQGTPTRTASARVPDTGSPARPKPAPPKRSETTKLSSPSDPRQTKAFIMNLDRVITLKSSKGCAGLASIPVPLPPRPAYVEGSTYLDTDDLPPPPAELLEGLRAMRRKAMPLPPIPAPGRR